MYTLYFGYELWKRNFSIYGDVFLGLISSIFLLDGFKCQVVFLVRVSSYIFVLESEQPKCFTFFC